MGGCKEAQPRRDLPQLEDSPQNAGWRLFWEPCSPRGRDGCWDMALGGSLGCSLCPRAQPGQHGAMPPPAGLPVLSDEGFGLSKVQRCCLGRARASERLLGPCMGDVISLTSLLFAGLEGAINLSQRWQTLSLRGQLLQAGMLLPALAQGFQSSATGSSASLLPTPPVQG